MAAGIKVKKILLTEIFFRPSHIPISLFK